MPTFNKCILGGRLARTPDLRYTASGMAVTTLVVAVAGRKRDGTEKPADFMSVTVWEKPTESAVRYLVQGQDVMIDGRLHTHKWETEEGEKRSRLQVHATAVQFGSKPQRAMAA